MKYNLFLFDADDTLFDFSASEFRAFSDTLKQMGHNQGVEELFATYRHESEKLWQLVEQGQISKNHLKTERFRKTFERHGLTYSAEDAGNLYLEKLPETCLLVDHAMETCRKLAALGTVAIITNGFKSVQTRRLEISGLMPYISFMVVSDDCGFEKPDVRFFEHTVTFAPGFAKRGTLVIGDRLETDVLGAQNFGVDVCWLNRTQQDCSLKTMPTYEIEHLSQLEQIVLGIENKRS